MLAGAPSPTTWSARAGAGTPPRTPSPAPQAGPRAATSCASRSRSTPIRPRGSSPTPASTPPAAVPRSPPARATVALVRGAPLLDAARVGAEEIAAELGGLTPAKRHAAELAADALHRALGGAARARAALRCPRCEAPRALVAMSGGVDSAVAALLTARAGEEVVCVTLELWADAENDGERSCCSAQAVRGARALAHAQRAAPPLDRPARGVPRRRRRGLVGGLRAGGHPQPLHSLQRLGAPRRDARARHAAGRRARWSPATTRACSTAPSPLLRMARRPAQGPELRARRARPRLARAAALPAGGA